MFRYQFPLIQGTELFPDIGYFPPVVCTTIISPLPLGERSARALAQQRIDSYRGDILGFHIGQRQNFQLGSTFSAQTRRTLPGLDMRILHTAEQERIFLTVFVSAEEVLREREQEKNLGPGYYVQIHVLPPHVVILDQNNEAEGTFLSKFSARTTIGGEAASTFTDTLEIWLSPDEIVVDGRNLALAYGSWAIYAITEMEATLSSARGRYSFTCDVEVYPSTMYQDVVPFPIVLIAEAFYVPGSSLQWADESLTSLRDWKGERYTDDEATAYLRDNLSSLYFDSFAPLGARPYEFSRLTPITIIDPTVTPAPIARVRKFHIHEGATGSQVREGDIWRTIWFNNTFSFEVTFTKSDFSHGSLSLELL